MKKFIYFIITALFLSNTNSFASNNNEPNDSLKNAITFSQSRLGSNNCAFKYNRNLGSFWWFKVGLVANGDYTKAEPKSDFLYDASLRTLSYGIIIGFDKHSLPTKGFHFIYGPHIIFSYINEKNTSDNPALPVDQRTLTYHHYNAGIGFTIGFYYNINDRFSVGSELNPYIVYKDVNDNNNFGTRQRGYIYDIFGNASIISLRYKW
jgi:hypothetical protein